MLWEPVNLTEACPAGSHVTACSPFGYIYLTLLVQWYGDSEDRRIQEKLKKEQREDEDDGIVKNIHNYEDKLDKEEYDFIVVGAGSAGCVVANRLSANKKWKVLLLEAGIEQPDVTLVPGLSTALLGSNIDWAYSTEPDGKTCLARPGGRCSWPRGKVMGGSSSINSMVYVRGNKLDYDGWADLGNDGWSYEDVLPYFIKSEKNLNIEDLDQEYHGIHGEQAVSSHPYVDVPAKMIIDAYHERGLPKRDINGAFQYGATLAQTFTQAGARVSTYNAFIQPIRYRRKNLTVKVKSEVFEIMINEDKVAYGVKYIQQGTVRTAFAKKEVIVSAGSINSPKLLMLSGLGPKEHLSKLNINVKQDLAVGENLHDHATFNGYIIALSNKTLTVIKNEQLLDEVYEYSRMKVKQGLLAYGGLDNAIGFLKTEPYLPAPDIQIHVGNAFVKEFINELITSDSVRILPTGCYNGIYPRFTPLSPKSRGKLLLNESNPHGPPLLYSGYYEDPSDMIPIIKAARFYLSLESTNAFKSQGASFVRTPLPACKEHPWGSDEYTVCLAKSYTSSALHPVGSCKMGPIWDKKAVVDPRLRVYGISGLRVIDSSIMPFIVRGNTNAPSIMIGEKGVAFILKDWLHKC